MKRRIQIYMVMAFCALCLRSNAQGNTIIGSEIQWKRMTNDTYEIKIIVYCDGSSVPSWNLPQISSDSCSVNTSITPDSALEHLTEDITPICKSGNSNIYSWQFYQYGYFTVVKHTLRYKIYLGNTLSNCCWYKIHWASCCRIGSSTGFSYTPYNTDAWFNSCINDNQSPEFRNPPDIFQQKNKTVRYSHEILDLNGDSLSYALVTPNDGSYNTNYSCTYPLSCVGGNVPSLNPTISGFNLNAATGELVYTPSSTQSAFYKLMVTEWRKDSLDVYQVIGKTAREMAIVVKNNAPINKTPVITGSQYYFEACAGSPICIRVNTFDDYSDQTYIKWNLGNTTAYWEEFGTDYSPDRVSGWLCWTPDDKDVRSLPYYFTGTVSDNHCYIGGMSAKNYSIRVTPRLKASTRVQCIKPGKYKLTLKRDSLADKRAVIMKFYASTIVGKPLNNQVVFTISNKDSASLDYYFGDEGKYILRTVIISGNCSYTYLDTIILTENPELSRINGQVFSNSNSNCKLDTTENPLPGTLISINAPSQSIYRAVYTDSKGDYRLFLDSGNFSLNAELPDYLKKLRLSRVCPTTGSYNIAVTNKVSEINANNFSDDLIKVPILSVDFNLNRMRPCTSPTGYFSCSNIGTKDTFNIKVYLVLPKNLRDTTATRPYIKHGDTLIFTIDTLKAGASINFSVVTIDCNPKLTGEYRCFKFGISPDNMRYDNFNISKGYDFSNIKTDAECLDSGYLKFTIKNEGEAMNDSNEFRLYHDSKLSIMGKFRLGANSKKEFMVSSTTGIYRLEANQNTFYPTFSNPHSVIRACRDTSALDTGNSNAMESRREGFTFREKCYRIVNSNDPNAISITPEGVGVQKLVKRGIALQNRIDFQNTGTDTAYEVVVIDTLPTYLDISTLELGGSSHIHTTEISGINKNVLKFTFKKIFLVDSNTNEKASHGFTTYSIKPYANIPSGTKIANTAFIFFDFNDPVVTNTAWVTINDADQLSHDFPLKLIQFPNLVLDSISDVCANVGSIDLNLFSNLKPEFCNDNFGKWFINNAQIIGHHYNLEKIKVGWGDTIPTIVLAEYNYVYLGAIIKSTVTFNVLPPPIVTLSLTERYFGRCDSIPKGFNIKGTMPQNAKSKSSFLIDQKTIKGNSFVPNAFDTGWHRVTHIFESSSGCTAFAHDSFYIHNIPNFEILADHTSGCSEVRSEFKTILFYEDGQLSEYLWDFGDQLSLADNFSTLSNPVHVFHSPGQYTVRCTITNSKTGCSSASKNTILIDVYNKPEAGFSFTPDSPFYAGVDNPEFSFHGRNQNPAAEIKNWKWWWDMPVNYNQPDDTISDPHHRYPYDTTSHTVTLQLTSNDGCTSEIRRTVRINSEMFIFVPNAFTPDGNNLNEKFKAVANGILSIQMNIYNQWGELVYYSRDIENGWNGEFKGNPAPSGIYIYNLKATGYGGEERSLNGTIHLIR